jgi:hypothetical protein
LGKARLGERSQAGGDALRVAGAKLQPGSKRRKSGGVPGIASMSK